MNNFSTDKQKFFDNSDSFVSAIATTPHSRFLIHDLHTGLCMLKVGGLLAPVVFLGSHAAISWLVENGFSSSQFSAIAFQPIVGTYTTL